MATLLRTAQFLTRSEAEAEDLTQETMTKAFRHLDSFESGTDMKAWLMRILRNTRIDRLRSAAAAGRPLSLEQAELDPPDLSADPADAKAIWEHPEQLLEEFSDQQMISALKDLPEEIRWTLMLVDVEQMDQKDAADILGVPVGTIKSRAHRGRAMLRQTLTPLARQTRLIRKERR